jgi:hypothetical protein
MKWGYNDGQTLANNMNRLLPLIALLLTVSAHAGAQNIDSLLREIRELDQGVRREFIEAYKSGVTDSLLVLNERMVKIDRANQKTVFALLNKQGWPEGLSEDANTAIFLVIDHADLSAQKKYLPLVREQADRGVIKISLWATLYDRVLMYTGKKQIYGTQTKTFFDKSKGAQVFYLWPLEDPANVDRLREEVGLPPLEPGANLIRDDSLSVEDLQKKMR